MLSGLTAKFSRATRTAQPNGEAQQLARWRRVQRIVGPSGCVVYGKAATVGLPQVYIRTYPLINLGQVYRVQMQLSVFSNTHTVY